jgi:hypothetical protein
VAAGDARTARLLFDLAREGAAAGRAAAARSAGSLEAIRQLPDFRLRIRWRFGGAALIGWAVRKYAPADTYEVYKRGERLRVDGALLGLYTTYTLLLQPLALAAPPPTLPGTLLGLDVNEKSLLPHWRRGGLTLLLAPPAPGEPPTLFVINHESRRYATTRPAPPPPAPPPSPRARLRVRAAAAGGAVRCRVWAEMPPPRSEADLKFEGLVEEARWPP